MGTYSMNCVEIPVSGISIVTDSENRITEIITNNANVIPLYENFIISSDSYVFMYSNFRRKTQ